MSFWGISHDVEEISEPALCHMPLPMNLRTHMPLLRRVLRNQNGEPLIYRGNLAVGENAGLSDAEVQNALFWEQFLQQICL